jgi:hypothetical protein
MVLAASKNAESNRVVRNVLELAFEDTGREYRVESSSGIFPNKD